MNLSGAVQRARQLAAGVKYRQTLDALHLVPLLQQFVKIGPAVQRTRHEDRPVFPVDLALAIKHRLQRWNAQLAVATDVTKLTREGRLAKRMMQRVGQVIALALEVKP